MLHKCNSNICAINEKRSNSVLKNLKQPWGSGGFTLHLLSPRHFPQTKIALTSKYPCVEVKVEWFITERLFAKEWQNAWSISKTNGDILKWVFLYFFFVVAENELCMRNSPEFIMNVLQKQTVNTSFTAVGYYSFQ